MKRNYIGSILHHNKIGEKYEILGWIISKRIHKNVMFIDMCDSTGNIQVVIENSTKKIFQSAEQLKNESAIQVVGTLVKTSNNHLEILAEEILLVGKVNLNVFPSPRSNVDIFDETLTDNLLKYRHLYIRNPKIMAILRFRNLLKKIVRDWFEKNNFTELDAPILVPAPLYEGKTAIGVKIREESVYLSQCAGFYLEAATHAFEKVYNMGPSFRGEESRSKRHLIEYWHIKAELAWGNREEIISIVEDILYFVTKELKKDSGELLKTIGTTLCTDGIKIPFPRINYRDAIDILKKKGVNIDFGTSLGSEEEKILSENYSSPFWIVGIPRKIEPFPYCIDENDKELTMVADLIANNGYGELLGVAEKINDPETLKMRMMEKGKETDPIYNFVKEVHEIGCVPHIAFGMGLERLMRWLLNIQHVRDCIPFPRVVRRNIMP